MLSRTFHWLHCICFRTLALGKTSSGKIRKDRKREKRFIAYPKTQRPKSRVSIPSPRFQFVPGTHFPATLLLEIPQRSHTLGRFPSGQKPNSIPLRPTLIQSYWRERTRSPLDELSTAQLFTGDISTSKKFTSWKFLNSLEFYPFGLLRTTHATHTPTHKRTIAHFSRTQILLASFNNTIQHYNTLRLLPSATLTPFATN